MIGQAVAKIGHAVRDDQPSGGEDWPRGER
jgi:hypothetical protein